jgi:hypothetical protein
MFLACLLVVLAIATGGVASAFWSGSGNGSGVGATGTTVAVTLGPGTPTAALYPGGRADVVLTISNPNRSAVFVGSLALDTGQGTGGYAVDAGHAGCNVSTLTYARQTNGGVGWTVPARVGAVDGTLSVTLPNALAMGLDAVNACQGAATTVYLKAGS